MPPEQRPGRLSIGIVGAGKVGAVLGYALRQAGHHIAAASGISEQSQSRIETLLPGVPRLSVNEVVAAADLVLLCVPDDVLPSLVTGIADTTGWKPGQLVAHTCGRYGTSVLEPCARQGAIVFAMHPIMTFTGTSMDVKRLVDCCFGVSASAPMLPIAQALVVEMGAEPLVVPEEHRALYHCALAHSANHLVTVIAQARDMLADAGITDAHRVLGPLVHAAADNALRLGDAALTGPIARGDSATVHEHVTALKAQEDQPDLLTAYRALALATIDRGERTHRLKADQVHDLRQALDQPPSTPPAHP